LASIKQVGGMETASPLIGYHYTIIHPKSLEWLDLQFVWLPQNLSRHPCSGMICIYRGTSWSTTSTLFLHWSDGYS